MRRYAQAFTLIIAIMAGFFIAGCGDKTYIQQGSTTSASLHFRNASTGQDITAWQLKPGEAVNLSLVDNNGNVLNSSEFQTPTVGENPKSSDTTKVTTSINGNNIVVTGNSSNTGDATVTARGKRNGTTNELTQSIVITVTQNPNNTNNIGTPNNNNTNTTAPMTDFEFHFNSLTGTNVTSSTLQAPPSGTTTIYLAAKLSGSNVADQALNASDLNGPITFDSSFGTLSTLNSGRLDFVANGKLGTFTLTASAAKNGSGIITRSVTIQVVNNPSQPSGGGGSGSAGTVLTSLTASATTLTPNAGDADQMAVSGSTTDPTVPNWMVPYPMLNSRDAVIDADGRLFILQPNTQVDVMAWGLGPVVTTGLARPAEAWNKATVSNTVQPKTSTTTPNGLIISAPGYMSWGERYQYKLVRLSSTPGGTDLTPNTQLNVNDTSVMDKTNNSSGQPFMLRALKPGIVNLSASDSGFNATFKLKIGVGNPEVTQFNGVKVIDPFVRFGMPFQDPQTPAQWFLPMYFNLSKCADRSKPGLIFLNGNINGTSVIDLGTSSQATVNGELWAMYLYAYTGTSGTINIPAFLYAGKYTGPVNTTEFTDTTKWSFPDNRQQSRFYDEVNNGTNPQDRNFCAQIRASADPTMVRVDQRHGP